MVRLLPRRREALDELTEGGDEGGDTVADFLFGGFGAIAFSADGVLSVGDLEGEGGNGGAVLVDLALSVAPKLAVFLTVFATLLGERGDDAFDAVEAFIDGHGAVVAFLSVACFDSAPAVRREVAGWL